MAGRYKRGWSAVHQKVFLLYAQGLTQSEIVEKTGLTRDRVRTITRTKQFLFHETAAIKSSVETARKLLESKLTSAAGAIVRLMKNGRPEERLRFDAAKEILYQCGMKPIEVVETRNREYSRAEIESSLTVIREVQAIEEKLSTQGSDFLLKRDTASSLSAPVTIDTSELKAPSDEERIATLSEEVIATNV